MRTLWNAIAFLAVVNLLALAFAGGWLYRTGRLDRDRVEAVREIFRRPVSEVEAERVAAEQSLADQAAESESEVGWSPVPVTNLDAADAMERFRDLGRVANDRLSQDAAAIVARIEDTFRQREAELAALRAAIEADQARLDEINARAADADFQQTVADLGEMKLDTAFAIVRVWLEEGRRTLVVDVLHAIDVDRRSALLGEFVDLGRDEVAADLQLALRERTALEAASTEQPNADSANSSSQPRSGTSGGRLDA
jgi:hypothetical protein